MAERRRRSIGVSSGVSSGVSFVVVVEAVGVVVVEEAGVVVGAVVGKCGYSGADE